MSDTVYKIVPASLWQSARQKGSFEGAPVDLADGFIHFSTAAQAKEIGQMQRWREAWFPPLG